LVGAALPVGIEIASSRRNAGTLRRPLGVTEVGQHMAMDKIQGSSLPAQSALNNFTRTGKAGESGRDEGSAPVGRDASGSGTAGDIADISVAGKQLVELKQAVEVGKAALAALPDVREDRVAQARERMAEGFYHSIAVREKVAERLSGVLGALDADSP